MPYSDFTQSPIYRVTIACGSDLSRLIKATGLVHVSALIDNPFDRVLYGLPIAPRAADKILSALKQIAGQDYTYEQVGIVLEDESLPTFAEARAQHALTIDQIADRARLPLPVVRRIDERGEGPYSLVKSAVAALSDLSGTQYEISKSIRGFFYLKEGFVS